VAHKVLFLCIGNAVRSQMAEAYARKYGADVVEPYSAGLAPARAISPLTRQALEERGVTLGEVFPKGLDALEGRKFDLIVNISGEPMWKTPTPVAEWKVRDPMGQKIEVYREAAQQIESLVMRLILELRKQSR
jgi:arsenate reductase (thioredoxin)